MNIAGSGKSFGGRTVNCKISICAIFLFSVFFSLVLPASAQEVSLESGYVCTADGLRNRKGKLFDESNSEKVVKKQLKKARSKKQALRASGASKKKIKKASSQLKALKTVKDQIAECFSGELFESPQALASVLDQITGDYPNGTYSLDSDGTPLSGSIASSFELADGVFSGSIVPDEILQILLGSDPLEFETETDGKSFPLTFEFPGTPIGNIIVTLNSDLSLSLEAPEVGIGDIARILWTGTFTKDVGFSGTIIFEDSEGETLIDGSLSLIK